MCFDALTVIFLTPCPGPVIKKIKASSLSMDFVLSVLF